jgi:hypothetical protein
MILDSDSFRLDDTNNTIYAIGDIHGDILPLIIALRDCCGVIKKKEGFQFKQNEIDKNMIEELNKEWDNKTYVHDLNYEWVGKDLYVVLCGDIINNSRGGIKPQEFPFEEAKILMFINSLNEQAKKLNCKIFKIIGNHDFDNLNGEILNSPHKNKLVTSNTANYIGYKQGSKDRFHYFLKGNPGAKLYAKDNCYLFLIIRDFIFVHGGISSDLFTIKNLNDLNKKFNKYILNTSDNTFDLKICNSNEYELANSYFNLNSNEIKKIENGLVKDRYFSQKKDIKSEDEIHRKNIEENNETEMCDQFNKKIRLLNQDLLNNGYVKNRNYKLVVGHSVQNPLVNKPIYTYNSTFDNLINYNSIKNEFISEHIYYGPEKILENGVIINNGISISCLDSSISIPNIYRLDVGMSRGVANYQARNDDSWIYSRTPQVIKINYENNIPKVTIIKSSLQNTKTHIQDYNILNVSQSGGYYNKYLKYKSKYLTAKQQYSSY